ncbi:FtsQ-type POTRA domain-containing protein [Iamia majanohamensis]|uniref:Cell division protein FtsQ n=1 Tax=Iamia majanohamensis TaxID=467976 RepID=A0AAE9Y6I7_9ACTN|nr:FtsQ-type POTRA domain-containing protein [Iamia majanohamensis]WCO65218.1 FtsQ-type POTRA domain-containing protein [Iamia majanohamensis]
MTVRPPAPRERTAPAPAAGPGRAPHPRMRARRVEVARDVGRRRRRRLNVVLAVVCLGVWTLVGLRSSLLDVDRVQVSGAEHTSADAVRAAAGIAPGEPMVGADLDGGTEAVAALPWTDEVRIARMWPGTVRIVVTERTPVAVVRTPGGWARLDAEGRVLDEAPARPDDLVALTGRRDAAPADTLPAADREVLATVAELPDALAPDVEEARRDDRGLVLALGEGWTVVVGDGEDLPAKAAAARAVREAADPADGCTIDVRVPDSPVLTPGGDCA